MSLQGKKLSNLNLEYLFIWMTQQHEIKCIKKKNVRFSNNFIYHILGSCICWLFPVVALRIIFQFNGCCIISIAWNNAVDVFGGMSFTNSHLLISEKWFQVKGSLILFQICLNSQNSMLFNIYVVKIYCPINHWKYC